MRRALVLALALAAGPVAAQVADQPDLARALDKIGQTFDGPAVGATFGLYKDAHGPLPAGVSKTADVAYGPDPRNLMDLFVPEGADGTQPIVLFVHGGGFVRGSKEEVAHIGGWLAGQGVIGVTMSYRLAPAAHWPAGRDDVLAAVAWLRAHPETSHGDVNRIFLVGNSAGTVHVAGAVAEKPEGVIGAVLISPPGLDLTDHPLDPQRDAVYFGTDPAVLAEASTLDAMAGTDLPLMVAWGEHDIPLVEAQTAKLLAARFAAKGVLPPVSVAMGHTHISIVEHLGTRDRVFGDDLMAFVKLTALRAGDAAAAAR